MALLLSVKLLLFFALATCTANKLSKIDTSMYTTETPVATINSEKPWDVESHRMKGAVIFSSFGPHQIPLLDCDQNGAPSMLYSKPNKPKCVFHHKYSNGVPEPKNVTFWIMDTNFDRIRGVHCFGIRRKIIKEYDGVYRQGGSGMAKEKLTKEQCAEMIQKHKTPEGYQMTFQGDGYFNYVEHRSPQFEFLKNKTTTWVDYHLQELGIGIDSGDSHIITMAGVLRECYADDGYCETFRGHFLWNPQDQNKCPIVGGSRVSCILLDDTLTCPSQQYTLTGITTKTVCNKTVGFSEQQIIFTPDMESWNNITLSVEISKVQRKRGKRSFSSQPRINAQFQFMHDMNKENLYLMQDRICNINKVQVGHGLGMADAEISDMLVAGMLGEGFRSKLEGNAIRVWKCKEVREYMFLNEPEDRCTKEWPVMYVHGKIKKKGWLSGSNELHSDSTPMDCPQAPFYFNTDEATYLLNTKSRFRSFPNLPNPGDPAMAAAFVTTTFTTNGEYGFKDMANTNTYYDFLRDVQKSARYHKAMESEDIGSQQELQGFLQQIYEKVGETVLTYIIITGVIIVSIVVVSVVLCCYCHCMKKYLCSSCSCKKKKNSTKQKKLPKQKKKNVLCKKRKKKVAAQVQPSVPETGNVNNIHEENISTHVQQPSAPAQQITNLPAPSHSVTPAYGRSYFEEEGFNYSR